jgi:hypothetical protein
MISSQVQRTLVKSPPELWAELSDPAALARHLGDLGEIHITRIDPERKVEWEAEDTSGTVVIKPSGWGTKVTLTATRETPEPPPSPALQAPIEPEPTIQAQAEPTVNTQPEPVIEVEAEPTVEASSSQFEHQPELHAGHDETPDPELEPRELDAGLDETPEPPLEPRRSFFARLFGRRRKLEPVQPEPLEPDDAFAAVRAALAPETFAAADGFAAAHSAVSAAREVVEIDTQPEAWAAADPPEEIGGASAEAKAAEEDAAKHVTAVLTAALDRLGAAHHRPFSRA